MAVPGEQPTSAVEEGFIREISAGKKKQNGRLSAKRKFSLRRTENNAFLDYLAIVSLRPRDVSEIAIEQWHIKD